MSNLISMSVAEVTFIGGAIVLIFICTRTVDHELLQKEEEQNHIDNAITNHADGRHVRHVITASTKVPSPSGSRE